MKFKLSQIKRTKLNFEFYAIGFRVIKNFNFIKSI